MLPVNVMLKVTAIIAKRAFLVLRNSFRSDFILAWDHHPSQSSLISIDQILLCNIIFYSWNVLRTAIHVDLFTKFVKYSTISFSAPQKPHAAMKVWMSVFLKVILNLRTHRQPSDTWDWDLWGSFCNILWTFTLLLNICHHHQILSIGLYLWIPVNVWPKGSDTDCKQAPPPPCLSHRQSHNALGLAPHSHSHSNWKSQKPSVQIESKRTVL